MMQGTIYSISISPKRGKFKTEVPEATIIEHYGIENDGHASDWGRQVSCLDWSSVQKANLQHHLHVGRRLCGK